MRPNRNCVNCGTLNDVEVDVCKACRMDTYVIKGKTYEQTRILIHEIDLDACAPVAIELKMCNCNEWMLKKLAAEAGETPSELVRILIEDKYYIEQPD